MPPFVCLRATLTGEGERLGHVYHDGLTKMGVWGAHAVRTRRRWVLGAHAPCRSDEHGRLWCIFGVTLARNDVCGASDVPQTQVFVSRSFCVRHKRKSSPAVSAACATSGIFRHLLLLRVPRTKLPVASLCHQPSTCVIAVLYAPHISKWTLHLQPSTPKNLAGGAVAGTIRSGKYIVKR